MSHPESLEETVQKLSPDFLMSFLPMEILSLLSTFVFNSYLYKRLWEFPSYCGNIPHSYHCAVCPLPVELKLPSIVVLNGRGTHLWSRTGEAFSSGIFRESLYCFSEAVTLKCFNLKNPLYFFRLKNTFLN